MKIRTLIVGYVLALALFLFAQRHPNSSSPTEFHAVIDLTHPVDLHALAHEPAGKSLSSPELFGTRIDAPAHFARGLWTVDQIPTERLIAPLVVLDVTANTANRPDYQISVEDIAKWEEAHSHIPLGSVIMARTGWDSRWNSIKDYRNADRVGTMHFPGFSQDAAKFLIAGRNALGLGIDTLSIDYGLSKDFPVRQYTLSHSVYQLENVANLDRAPATGGMVVVAPTKLESGSDGPVRILALVR
ncbi:MAG TPA: cyclase family protein [Terriglobales bacterium]|nr:cyclase family protein [Terriglobales bacterium]